MASRPARFSESATSAPVSLCACATHRSTLQSALISGAEVGATLWFPKLSPSAVNLEFSLAGRGGFATGWRTGRRGFQAARLPMPVRDRQLPTVRFFWIRAAWCWHFLVFSDRRHDLVAAGLNREDCLRVFPFRSICRWLCAVRVDNAATGRKRTARRRSPPATLPTRLAWLAW